MDLKNDVIPVSELKHKTKEILARVMKSGNPILVTQNGHSAVVIVDIAAYQETLRKLELLEAIAKGEQEILQGKGLPHQHVKDQVVKWQSKKK